MQCLSLTRSAKTAEIGGGETTPSSVLADFPALFVITKIRILVEYETKMIFYLTILDDNDRKAFSL